MKKLSLSSLPFFLFVIFGVVTNVYAIPIDSSVIVRADFDLTGQTPAPPYDLVNVLIEFDATIDGAEPGEALRTSLFDSGDNLIKSETHVYTPPLTPPYNKVYSGHFAALDFGSRIYTPSIGDYIIIDNIVGSFELTSVRPLGRVLGADPMFTPRVDSRLTTSPVPEPSTMLLFGTGLIGLTGWCRKKIKKY